MSHLSSEELVDVLDGALTPARAAHLEACPTCQREVEGLTGIVTRAVEAKDVPEPSPLFWAHLSSRIRDGLAGPVARTWKDLVWWPGSAWAAGVAAVVVVLLVSQSAIHDRGDTANRLAPASSATTRVLDGDPADDPDTDQAWAVVRTVADEASDEAAHDAGIATRPDAAERITQELSSREKSELAQLLAGELKGAGN